MKLLFFVFVVCFPLLCLGANIPYTNCGQASDHVQITSATANTWPPIKGQPLSLDIEGKLDQQVTGGTYALTVAFDSIPIINQQGQLSSLPNVTLPINAGPLSIKETFTLPSSVPSGSVNIQVSANDQNNAELFCIQLAINMQAIEQQAYKTSTMEIQPTNNHQHQRRHRSHHHKHQQSHSHQHHHHHQRHHQRHDADVSISMSPTVFNSPVVSPSLLNVPIPFTNCTVTSDLAVIEGIYTNIWPPVAGTPLIITALGYLKSPVQDGYFSASATFDNIPVYNKKEDLSRVTHLPLPAGNLNITKTVKIPSFLPSGTLAIQATAYDNSNDQILCFALQVAF